MGIFSKSEKGFEVETRYAREQDPEVAEDPVFGEVVEGGQK